MKNDFKSLGIDFEWHRELSTSDPLYYKWTQWIFIQLFQHGLAYKSTVPALWDPVDRTYLANEQIDQLSGKCWRSGAKPEVHLISQWLIRTRQFTKRLYDGLQNIDSVNCSQVIRIQSNWIGEPNGYSIDLGVYDKEKPIKGFQIPVYFEKKEFILRNCVAVINPNSDLLGIKQFRQAIDAHDIKLLNPHTQKFIPIILKSHLDIAQDHSEKYRDARLPFLVPLDSEDTEPAHESSHKFEEIVISKRVILSFGNRGVNIYP